MAIEAATTIKLISAFKKEIVEGITEFKQDIEHLLDDGLTNYVDSQRTKYEFTKTFLFGNHPVKFYESFFAVDLLQNHPRKLINTNSDILKILDNDNFIAIIGTAGSGKTMLMKHFFLTSIYSGFKIPITIELRDFNNSNATFFDFLKSKIYNNKLTLNDKILDRLFQEGSFLFLLDGFDEIFSNNINKLVVEIEDFIDRYPKNKYILSSRPGTSAENFPRFCCYHVQPLSNIQIKKFIVQQVDIVNDEELGNKLLDTIVKPENSVLIEYLNNPLLLSMFILTFRSNPELPKTKSKFYWNVFDTLVTKHDSLTKKGGYQHEKKSKLKNEELEMILKWLGYLSFFEGKYTFDSHYFNDKLNQIKAKLKLDFNNDDVIYDLTVSISIIVQEGIDFRFPHKTLQEYFSALLIKEQTPEGKEKVYNHSFLKLNKFSKGGNESFYSLLIELDKSSFYNLFVLKRLKIFLNKLNSLSVEQRIKFAYKECDFTESYFFNSSNKQVELLASFSVTPTLNTSILLFFGNRFYDPINLGNKIKTGPQFNELICELVENKTLQIRKVEGKFRPKKSFGLGKERFSLIYHKLDDETIKKLNAFCNFEKLIDDLMASVAKIINKIEVELKSENDDKMSLLDI